ncbi:RNAse Z [Fibrisoma montanum]|uniref:RNAse Z n=1 Tax=Fibrisoma montanum TaxID=2305895 RepID=A0A418MFN0_9BACT|nr:MBL fold metallo-hydrolase [Fibrisoma montanum]RIV25619.1 RNAse Z [Fibrisoma montanum]
MTLTITGYSTALFSTWYFIEELRLLFDAGDGVSASLLQKSRKIDHIFISHADRDHVTGLLRLNELNAREGFPQLFFPADSGSFPALETFSKQLDERVKQTRWTPVRADEHVEIQNDTFVKSVRNNHVIRAQPHEVKSLGYQVYQVRHKLKPDLLSLPGETLRQLASDIGRENMTYEVRTNLLAYSGDTPIENFEQWDTTGILIHEATFLTNDEFAGLDMNRNRHSTLESVLQIVADLRIDILILGHFSSRYSHAEIDEAIRRFCKQFRVKIPVYRLLPGQIHRDILNEEPIN